MKRYVQGLVASLLMGALFTACSRPVAYFQPTPREHSSYVSKPATVAANQLPALELVSASGTAPIVTPVAQATQALDKVDALVRNDQKLASDKTVQKRLNRIRTMLVNATNKADLSSTAGTDSKKMNVMQRLMVKKMNRTISKQLAPANPEKAMAVKGILALGAVILIAGILLLLLTTGTGATIGVIGVIAGLALLLIGLI